MLASLAAAVILLLDFLLQPFRASKHKLVASTKKGGACPHDASFCTTATVPTRCGADRACDSQHECLGGSVLISHDRRLILDDFVARASSKDILDLCQLLRRQKPGTGIRTLVFRDTVQGASYRRWLFKKTGLYRHVLNAAAQANIDVRFEATVEICADCMSPTAIVSLLCGLKADPDVKSLLFTGSLYYRDAMWMVSALQGLLKADQRHWRTVSLLNLHFMASNALDARLARKSCHRTLRKVAKQRYISIRMD